MVPGVCEVSAVMLTVPLLAMWRPVWGSLGAALCWKLRELLVAVESAHCCWPAPHRDSQWDASFCLLQRLRKQGPLGITVSPMPPGLG